MTEAARVPLEMITRSMVSCELMLGDKVRAWRTVSLFLAACQGVKRRLGVGCWDTSACKEQEGVACKVVRVNALTK